MLAQIFNFVDSIGGKASLNAQSKFYLQSVNINYLLDIVKVFKIRGLFEPSSKEEVKELDSALAGL